MRLNFKKVAVLLAAAALLTGCVQAMVDAAVEEAWAEKNVRKYDGEQKVISNGQFEVTFRTVYAGETSWNYYAHVYIKNMGETEAVFKSLDVEVMDKDGLSFFTPTKDSDSVTTSGLYTDMLTTRTLRPGRKTSGFLMFGTRKGEANSDVISIHYGDQKIELKDIGLFPYEEWKVLYGGKKKE